MDDLDHQLQPKRFVGSYSRSDRAGTENFIPNSRHRSCLLDSTNLPIVASSISMLLHVDSGGGAHERNGW